MKMDSLNFVICTDKPLHLEMIGLSFTDTLVIPMNIESNFIWMTALALIKESL